MSLNKIGLACIQKIFQMEFLTLSLCSQFGSYPQEFIHLVDRLHSQCKDYVTANLHKVIKTKGWQALSPRIQTQMREGELNSCVPWTCS